MTSIIKSEILDEFLIFFTRLLSSVLYFDNANGQGRTLLGLRKFISESTIAVRIVFNGFFSSDYSDVSDFPIDL